MKVKILLFATDCPCVTDPRIKSHHRQSWLSQQPLLYTALSIGCTPLLQCLDQLSILPSTVWQNACKFSDCVITCNQRIFMNGCIAHHDVIQAWMFPSAVCSYWRLNDTFWCKRRRTVCQCVWISQTTPKNCPFPWGGGVWPHLTVLWAHVSQTTNCHLDRFGPVCIHCSKTPMLLNGLGNPKIGDLDHISYMVPCAHQRQPPIGIIWPVKSSLKWPLICRVGR